MLIFLHGLQSHIGEKFVKSGLKALVAVFCWTFSVSMANIEEVLTLHGKVPVESEEWDEFTTKGSRRPELGIWLVFICTKRLSGS